MLDCLCKKPARSNKEHIKAPHYWPCDGKTRCITLTKGQYCGKTFHVMTAIMNPTKKQYQFESYHLLWNKWMFETPTMLDPIKINDCDHCDHIPSASVHCGQEFGWTWFRRCLQRANAETLWLVMARSHAYSDTTRGVEWLSSYRWLSARLQYLHCYSTGVSAVLHYTFGIQVSNTTVFSSYM